MAVASLEVSTSSAKCILYCPERGILAESNSRYSPDIADGPTQDPDGVLGSALSVVRDIVSKANHTGAQIDALGLAGTWHSLLVLDGRRRPLGRIRTWADLEGADIISRLRSDLDLVKKAYHSTGCMVHAIYPAWKLHYLTGHKPTAIPKNAFISSQVEHVFESLTGQALVSRCIASGTGLMNIHTLDWDDAMLEMAGIGRHQLSALVEGYHTEALLPAVAASLGLPEGLPVAVGCSDGAMNQLAIGGLMFGRMSMSVGTSGALRLVHPGPVIPDTPSTWCYYLMDGMRLAGAAVNNATNCVDWFLGRRGMYRLGPEAYSRFSEGAAQVDLADAPFFMPFLFGERCPGWRENRTGGFIGLKASHEDIDLYYSILEGILFNMRQCYDILVQVAGRPDEVLVSGGILNSQTWMQMAADIFAREISTTGTVNDSTVGGALMALAGLYGPGFLHSHRPPASRTYRPRDDRKGVYESRYGRYLEFYGLLD